MIIILDYELGNPRSIQNMLTKLGYSSIISNDVIELENASFLIIPGVGNFKKGMSNLKRLNLIDTLNNQVLVNKVPTLGICLGMQLMTDQSDEGSVKGLGWINAEVRKFSFDNQRIKVPHMGWNEVSFREDFSLLFPEFPPRFYFVHSYYVYCNDSKDIFSTTLYENNFVSAFKKNNILGVQFHPEKSHKFGMEIFNFFLKSAKT